MSQEPDYATEPLAEIRVICPECGKRVSLRGLNGHLRFDHDYELDKAKKIASGFHVDGTLNRLEQEVMAHVTRLYELKVEAEALRQAKEESIIGDELYERMITQKGQELTATTRYLKSLEENWGQRMAKRTGIRHGGEGIESAIEGLLGEAAAGS